MRRLEGIDRQEFEQTQGDSEGQGSLACCNPWGCKVRHDLATEQQILCLGNCSVRGYDQENLRKLLGL